MTSNGDWFDGAGNGNAVDVAEVMDDLVIAGVQELVSAGALLSLGTTSDGGALGVTVTVDGRWRREYFRDATALQAWLAEAIPAVRSAKQAESASAARGSRQRRSRGL
jgi:hypothetical protein